MFLILMCMYLPLEETKYWVRKKLIHILNRCCFVINQLARHKNKGEHFKSKICKFLKLTRIESKRYTADILSDR